MVEVPSKLSVTETLAVGKAASATRRWEGGLLAAVALGTALAPINSTMIAVALPEISDDFGVGVRDVGWIVVGYLIGMAVTQPIAGKLGDLFGRRPLFIGAVLGFMAFSIGAALAPDLPALLVMRVGQALTSATAIPNGAALIREQFPERRRASAFGVVGASAGLAAAVGPLVGGGMIAVGGWRAMFWLNLPLAFAALALAWRSFPRGLVRRRREAFDFRGAASLAVTLTALALVASAISDGDKWKVFGLTVAALLSGALFLQTERTAPQPLINLGLLRRPGFGAATATILFSNMAMYATLLVMPLFLTDIQGREAAKVGVALGALSLPVILLSALGGHLADRWGRRRPALIGGVLTVAGLAPFLALDAGWSLGAIDGLLLVVGAGMALQLPAIQAAAADAAPERDAGMASGVYSLGRYIGSIVGSAVLAAIIGSSVDAHATDDRVFAVFVMVVVAAACAALTPLWLRKR